MIARFLVLLLLFLPGLAGAAEFRPHRGISLDTWLTWPAEERWDERDVMLPYPEWQRAIGAAELDTLKAAGLDFVRVPLDPAPLLSERTADFRDAMLDGIVEAAARVNAAGLNALLDLHAIPSGGRSFGTAEFIKDDGLFDRYVELVAAVAGRLGGADPEKVALELMNEPVTGCEGGEARAWADRLLQLHAAARKAAPRLTLVLSGACWGSAEGLAAVDPAIIGDDNVLWSFHSYDPFLLTHQGAGWAGDFIPYVTGLPYPPHAAPKGELDAALEKIRERMRAEAPVHRRAGLLAYLDEQVAAIDTEEELAAAMEAPFAVVAAWADKHGVRPDNILLGEFGMIRRAWEGDSTVPASQRAAFYRDMIGHAERHGFAWSMWSYGSDFGVVDEFGGARAEPDILDMVRALPR